jgi:hypothetical protein
VFLERTVQNLTEYEYIQGCTAELVFNLDEIGMSDWEDCKVRKAVISETMRGQAKQDTHGISRKLKHISVIACVFAAGEPLTPYSITLQDSPWVREQLKKHHVRFAMERI